MEGEMFSLGLLVKNVEITQILKDVQYFSSRGCAGMARDDSGNKIAVQFAWSIENTEE